MAKKKKSTKKSKKSYIAKAPIRRLMKREGADLVAEDALVFLISKIEDEAKAVTKDAISIVKDDKRKKVTAMDVKMATLNL